MTLWVSQFLLLLFLFISRRAFFLFLYGGRCVDTHTHTHKGLIYNRLVDSQFFSFFLFLFVRPASQTLGLFSSMLCVQFAPFVLDHPCVFHLCALSTIYGSAIEKGGGFSSGPLLFVVFLAAAYSSSFSSGFFLFFLFLRWANKKIKQKKLGR